MNKTLSLLCALFATVAAGAQTTGTSEAMIGGEVTDVQWVQLWENGPKWAVHNLGATTPEEYGTYYQWSADDIATTQWGGNWQMPSRDDYESMKANCEATWINGYNGTSVKGILYTGKGDYSANSIFIPASGYNDGAGGVGISGNCWTSTPYSSNQSWYFGSQWMSNANPPYLDHGTFGPAANTYRMTVRAILKEYPTVKLNTKGYATYSHGYSIGAVIATEGVDWYMATVQDNVITLTKAKDKASLVSSEDAYIPAGCGVLLYGGEANAGKVVTFKAATNEADVWFGDLKATTTATEAIVAKPQNENIFALNTGNRFLRYTGSSFIANRAFFELSYNPLAVNAKAMTIVFADDEETTSITSINNEQLTINMAGAKNDGKYFENGRIVIINNGVKYNTTGQMIK